MSVLSTTSTGSKRTGSLWARGTESTRGGGHGGPPVQADSAPPAEPSLTSTGSHRIAYTGLYLFTLLLYLRPGDLLPSVFGQFPLVKVIAIATIVAYVAAKISSGERLTAFPIELKMLTVIVLLGIAFIPLAAAPKSSIEMLTDSFLKVAAVFVLMVNLIDTPQRLRSMLKLVVVSGFIISLGTIRGYLAGNMAEFETGAVRIEGIVGGIFGNPNDLATALDVLLPLAVALALSSKGIGRLFYFAGSAVMAFAIVLTFSRGGFLGLAATGGVLLWKIGRHNRLVTVLAAVLALGVLSSAVPNGYTDRLFTILHTEKDETGSAQARQELLKRGFELAKNHLLLGVGMANFQIYSIHNQVAHNSYLQISTELGIAGLIAYLVMILAPMRSLRRIERQSSPKRRPKQKDIFYLSVGVQAAILSYMVCSFFLSIQYQWYIYLLVAYAVVIRTLPASASSREQVIASPATREVGTLWSV
jgi:O-antigen ligase